MGKYDNLLFKRGFLLTDLQDIQFPDPLAQKVFNRFHCFRFFNWHLYFDDCVPIGHTEIENSGVVLLGLTFNPFDGADDANQIAETLLQCRQISERRFVEYLSELSGRFVVFLWFEGALEVFPDTCATRTVFYDTTAGHVIFSSHATLIAELMQYEVSDEAYYFFYHPLYKKAPLKRLPGLTSPYDEVRPLTPNTKVNAQTKRITRFFPFEDNPVCTDYEALEAEVAAILVTQMQMLHKKSPIMMSLSAGLDTRVTLAASRSFVAEMEFFTHLTRNKTHIQDAKIACAISRQFGLHHTLYEWSNEKYRDGLDDFEQIWLANLGIPRGLPYLNKLYADAFPQGKIHLRSNIVEIAKADLSNHERFPLSPETLAYLYTTTPMKNDKRVIQKFEEMMLLTDFTTENLHNYDFYDVFEWEFIMCLWQSWLLLESDVSHDTFQLFNNRKLLCKALSLPYEDRLSHKLFLGVIRKLWPELLAFPINGVQYT